MIIVDYFVINERMNLNNYFQNFASLGRMKEYVVRFNNAFS